MEEKKHGSNIERNTNAIWGAQGVEGSLPKLSRFERHWAGNPNQKSWAFKNMSAGVGHVWHMDDIGLVLQVASEDTIRLLTVVDHDGSSTSATFYLAGMTQMWMESGGVVANAVLLMVANSLSTDGARVLQVGPLFSRYVLSLIHI